MIGLISYLKESQEAEDKSFSSTEVIASMKEERLSIERKDKLSPIKEKLIRMLQEDIEKEFNERIHSHALNGRKWEESTETLSVAEKNLERLSVFKKE